MKGKKFEIAGRRVDPPGTHAVVQEQALDRFIEGKEVMTTMTFQLPERKKRALKVLAGARGTTVKALLDEAIDKILADMKQ
jgi:hypothetical protein